MSKTKYLFGAALVVALVAGPTAAYATVEPNTTETEVTSSPDTALSSGSVEPTTELTPNKTEILTTPTIPTPVVETVTPSTESPVVTPPVTDSEATSPTSEAPAPSASTRPTTSPKYILAVWQNEAGAPKFPQYLVTSYATDSTDVKVLSKYATECGTFYQSDLYANDAQTAKLIARGVLDGGWESWPDNGTQRYDTFTTAPCPVYMPPVLDCEPGTAPGWLNEHGDPTACVDDHPVITPPTEPTEPEEEPSSPSIPVTPVTPTAPTPVTSTPVSSSQPTVSSDAPRLHTALKATGTTTDLPGDHTVTSTSPQKLAMTGSEDWKIAIVIGAIMILVGAFAVWDVRRYKRFVKFHPNNKDKQ